jgi:LysR family glycine cleavage system transcriptional activator
MRRLPPFPELVAFEAVARHLSFTRAAAELCITQSAVSHRVGRLEKHFGAKLIRRINPGIELTETGSTLLPELQAALDSLSGLGLRRERRLRVAAGSALCTWWLAGRLSAFMRQRPGVSVELIPIENDATIPEVDVRILWVSEGDDAPSAVQTPLFNEQVFIVCSPRLLDGKRVLNDWRELRSLTLLHKTAHASGEWSWSVWLERLGIDKQRRDGELHFADMSLVMSAAVEGAGVALVRSLLAHDALCDGRLMIPVRGIEPMRSSKKHVARWRRGNADDVDIKAFVAWLVAEAERTLASTDALLDSTARTPKADPATAQGGSEA